jgi:prevent-host-death family protein
MGVQKRVTASAANRNFSGVLRRVAAGEEIVVTSHGQPVAKIVPVGAESERRRKAWEKLLVRLSRQRKIRVANWTREEIYER